MAKNSSLETKSVNPECQIVVFNWLYETNIDDINLQRLASSTPHDISNYIASVRFSKMMNSPSGQFEITLENDRDWKEYIKKGSWCIIYMSNDGGLSIPDAGSNEVPLGNGLKGDGISVSRLAQQREKIRAICYIDDVRVSGTVGAEKGEFDVVYSVTGRDIGVVYEETEIWHNRIQYDETLLKTASSYLNANQIKTVDKLLEVLHQLIFSPEQLVNKDLKDDSLTSIALQWLLPNLMFTALGIPTLLGTTYYGNIPDLLEFDSSEASYPVANPLTDLNGVAWSRLKEKSIEQFHELFTELNDDGLPRLYFRPIPWRLSNGAKFSRLAPSIKKFKDLPVVELPNIDILNFNVGEDNHARYNLFWTTVNSSLVNIQTSLQMVGDNNPKTGFPRTYQNSIRRHGLRLMYTEINTSIVFGSEKVDPDLIRQYNELALEYWKDADVFESGTIEIIGNNEIRLGKVVHIDAEAQYNSDKYFYIEGYSDSFIVNDNGSAEWVQGLILTRGIEKDNLNKGVKSDKRAKPYRNAGDFTRRK